MRIFHSLKSTHWVIWSSPLLLLVLVFTLTTSSSSAPRRHATSPSTTTITPTTTTPAAVTTTTSPPPTTTTMAVRAVTHAVNASTSPSSTSLLHVRNSSSATASNVKSVANAPAESASSGVLTGRLTPSFAVADVPLDGPGTWNVVTSAPARETLRCQDQSISVQTEFVIGAHERCQLSIVPLTRASSLTWQLTPVG